MACAVTTVWGNLIKWTTPNQKDISHYEIYRRTDAVTASITTADVVAKRYHITNTETPSTFYNDLFSSLNTDTAYWYWVKSVAYDGQRSTGPHPTITADRSTIISIADPTVVKDPTGFPNRTDSEISFTDGTRTFSISPAVTSFDYYQDAKKFTKCAAETVVVGNTTGMTWFYYDSATLSSVKDPSDVVSDQLIRQNPLIAMVYYNTATGTSAIFGDERHGLQMAGATHSFLHFVMGMQYITGLAPDGITADQSGDLDPHAQFGINAGGVTDEDVYHQISSVGRTAGLNILYRNGAGGPWEKTTNAGFSILTTGTGRMAFNQNIAGNWSLVENTNVRYALCHVFASNDHVDPLFAIVGQHSYATQGTAREGATTEINDLLLGDLPSPEIRPLATFIYQTSNAYGNSVKSRVRTTDTGEDYVDWRTSEFSRGAGASDHGSLAGLSDDDHSQYVINDGSRGAQTISADVSFGNAVTVSGAFTVNDTATVSSLTVTANASVGGTLHVSGAVTFGSTLAVSGISSLNNDLNVSGNLTVAGTATVSYLTVTAAASIQTTLHVSGAVTFGSTLTVSSSATIGTSLAVCGTTTLHNNVIICGALTICGSATLNGTALGTGSTLGVVYNASSITTSNLEFVTADFTVTTGTGTCATVSLASGLVFDGGITINGGANISGNLTVSGNTSLNGTLTVSGAASFNTIITCSNLTVCGTLTVQGTAITNATGVDVVFNGSAISTTNLEFATADFTVTTGTGTCATVSLASGLVLDGGVTVNGGLTVSGTATLQGATTVSGGLTVNTLSVTGAASVQNTLHVSGAVTLGDSLTVSGATSFHNSVIICGALTICGSATLNGTALGTGAAGNAVYIEENATAITDNTGTDLYLNFGTNLEVTTASGSCATVSLENDITINNLTLCADATICGALTVAGTATFSNTVNMSSGLTVQGNVGFNANVDVLGNLVVDGGVLICGALTVSGTATLDGITNAANILPSIDNAYVLGTGAFRWSDIATRQVSLNVNSIIDGTVDGIIDVEGDIVPAADNTYDIGSSTDYYQSGYFKTQMNIGNTVTPSDYKVSQVDHTYTTAVNDTWGQRILSRVTPSSNSARLHTGIGGYNYLSNSNFNGATLYGLDFAGAYVVNAASGHTAMTTYGIRVAGGATFNGTINADTMYGLYAQGFRSDGAGVVNTADTVVGIQIADSSGTGATTQKMLAIDTPVHGTSNYQVVLSGSNTASCGIWFDGTSGDHLVSDGTDMCVSGNLNVGGELKGSRQSFGFSINAAGQTGFNAAEMAGGVTTTASQGYRMIRDGSLVGISVQGLIAGYTGAGNFTGYSQINGATKIFQSINVTGNGYTGTQGTAARGTYAFSAGDILSMIIAEVGAYTFGYASAVIEVVYDS